MKAPSREKAALIVFFLLVALGIGGLIGYLMIGHNWNVAATNIDDAAGSMEGYTALVYEGTVNPSIFDTKEGQGEKPLEDTSDKSPLFGADKSLSQLAPEEGLVESPDKLDLKDSVVPEVKFGEKALQDSMDIDDVVESYQGKKSLVFKIDTIEENSYVDGYIFRKGDKRIGVISVDTTEIPFTIKRKVTSFEKYKVDYIIAIVPDVKLVQKVKGIDIVISTQEEGLFFMGETINQTFYVSAPQQGSIGAILISPSGVVTAKVVSK